MLWVRAVTPGMLGRLGALGSGGRPGMGGNGMPSAPEVPDGAASVFGVRSILPPGPSAAEQRLVRSGLSSAVDPFV